MQRDILQTQLVTASGKPKIYFATARDRKQVVTKGPLTNAMYYGTLMSEN